VAFGEALKPEFKAYQHQVILNARALANSLVEEGIELVSGGTDNHLMLVKLIKNNVTGKEIEHLLDECHITVNKNSIPNDPASPFITSGIRLGTPSVTTRGMKEKEMVRIGKMIANVIKNKEAALEEVNKEVAEICKNFPLYANDVNI